MFFGDSLVAGVGDPTGGGWVARIVSACFEAGIEVTAYNLGVRRETSVEIAARWRSEAMPRMLPDAEHRIVLSFGTNDTTLEHSAVRVPGARSRQMLTQLLDDIEALGFAPLLISPAPVDDVAQNRRIADLSISFSKICGERGTPFIDVLEPLVESSMWMSEVSASDGAHPGAAGYETLAQILIERGLISWLAAL